MNSLEGLRVWITRPQPEADASARRWSSRGAHPIVLPLLEVRGLPLSAETKAELHEFESDLVVVTSSNVAEHFLREFGTRDARGRPWRLACVGRKTARRAEDLGFEVVLTADRATGKDLARTILETMHRPACLVPGGRRQRPELIDALTAAGCAVRTVTIYDTLTSTPAPPRVHQLLETGVDVAACYSPSAVEALVSLVGPRAVKVAALGATTAAEVERLGAELVACPEEPGESALLESVIAWWKRRTGASNPDFRAMRAGIRSLLLWSAVGMGVAAAIGALAVHSVRAAGPDFEAMLVGCTAGRLPGSPWAGLVGIWLLAAGVGALAPSPIRSRGAALMAATSGPLFFGSVEGWMSFTALTLQVGALVAFARRHRRASWLLAVLAAWVWPPAALAVVAIAVGEVDRAHARGSSWASSLLDTAMPTMFALAAVLPAWVMRTDTYLPVTAERGAAGVAKAAGLWTHQWPREVTAAAWTTTGLTTVLTGLGLLSLGLLLTLGLVRVIQRAKADDHYAAMRLCLGLGLWTLVLTGALGLGRGSWGSTQGMLHVAVVLLLVEGAIELRGWPGWRRLGGVAVLVAVLGWSAGLYEVASQWARSSPFLH